MRSVPEASPEGWPEWFQSIGDKLVDIGSPMANGFVIHSHGRTSETASSLSGYSIVRVEEQRPPQPRPDSTLCRA
jgi:hypothetical protein